MKVAVNTLFLIPDEVGGSETYLREILQAVAKEHPDIELVVVTNLENDEALRNLLRRFPQCSFYLLPIHASNRYVRILTEQFRLPFSLQRIRPDVLWSPGNTMPMWAPCRQVVSIHDMQYRTHPDDLTPLARWTTHMLVSMATRRADCIVTISQFSKQEIIRHTACASRRIAVSHHGVDPGFASTRTQELEIRNPKPYILCVANSYPHKNLHRLVEAFGLLTEKIPHHLLLVGKPRLGEKSLQHALKNVPSERVHRRSNLSYAELIQAYRQADLFVFPSLYEGFGLPVLEAMMAGTLVITTREGALPEVCGDEAIYTNGHNASNIAHTIQETLGQAESERHRRIAQSRARANRFTWSSAAAKTVEAWQAAMRLEPSVS